MISRKRIVFVVALTFAISVSTISVATLGRRETAVAAAKRIKVLRRKDQTHVKPTAAEVTAQEPQNERKLKVKEFKDMPVKIKEVRNLQSDTWYKDLEIEIKNTSNKPIYGILAHLQFPDVYRDPNRISGIIVEFGLRKYGDIRVVANPLDPHVKPGESCVLKINKQYWGGLRWDQEHTPEKVRKLDLKFAVISFGDETGFAVEAPRDYRIKKSRLLHHGKRWRPPPQDGCGSCARYIMSTQPF